MNGSGTRHIALRIKLLSHQISRGQPRISHPVRTLAYNKTLPSSVKASSTTSVLRESAIQPISELASMSSVGASSRKNVHLVVLIHGLWGQSLLICRHFKSLTTVLLR